MALPPSSTGHNHSVPLPLYSQQVPKKHPFAKTAVETSCQIIDNEALRSGKQEISGFPYGIISSISGGNSSGKTLIAMHAITSHLLSNPESHVAWVDTDGNFSAQRLLEIVALRLGQQQQTESKEHTSRQELLQQAGKVLDRVQITKAFDMDAVLQALEEIKTNMEDWEKEMETKEAEVRKERQKIIRSSVDSEDEMPEDDEQDEKEVEAIKEEDNGTGQIDGMKERVGVLVVDTISTLAERVRLKTKIPADSILTTFSRITALLAKNWSIAVLLLNTPPISNPHQLPQQPQQRGYQPANPTSSSVFAEIKQSPNLDSVLNYAVDLNVMLSYFDGALEGWKEVQQRGQRRRGVEPIVFEVVSDRQGGRTGKWVVIAIQQNGHDIVEFPWPQKENGPPVKMRSAFRGGLE